MFLQNIRFTYCYPYQNKFRKTENKKNATVFFVILCDLNYILGCRHAGSTHLLNF